MSRGVKTDLATRPAALPSGVWAEIVPVGPAKARHLRDTCHFERQRTISWRNVDYLAREMKNGWFVPGTPILMAELPDGQQLLLNGNHTLEAIVKAEITLELCFIHVPVADRDAAGHLYGRMDMQKRRTWAESYKAAGFVEGVLPHSRWINALGAAIIIIRDRFRSEFPEDFGRTTKMSREIQLALAQYYGPTLAALVGCQTAVDSKLAKLVMRAPVLAVALETFRFQPDRATEFWSKVAADDRLGSGDPAKALLNYLRETRGIGGKMRLEASGVAAHCWNAFWQEEPVSVLQPRRYRDFKLWGTPWDGTYDAVAAILAELGLRE